MGKYVHFVNALRELAPTNEARAKALGCSKRAIAMYLSGRALPHVVKIKRIAVLDEALTMDIRPSEKDNTLD